MATVGSLVVNLGLNAKSFGSGLTSAQGMLGKFGAGIGSLIGKLGMLGAAGAALVGLGSIGGAISFGVEAAAQAEVAQVAFTTIIGDADVAKKTLGDLSKFAAETPFETPELTNASRSLLAFGVNADELIPTLRAVGDISSGIGAPIEEIAELYGKAKVQGRLFAQDINQLTGRGIPIIGELAKQFGVTDDKVKELVESGSVNFGHLQAAFASMSGEGGQFGGMMAAQSATLSGMWSTLKDTVGMALREIGQVIIEEFDFKGAIGNMTSFADTFKQDWLPTIRGVIHAVAETWNGAVILITELWNGWVGPAVAVLADFVSNIDVYWGIALQNVVLFATNAGARITTFFTNVGEWMSWFGSNWQVVLSDIGRLIVGAVVNYVKQFSDFFKAIYDFAMGKGFNFKPTALTDGFTSQIKELPKLTEAAVNETTPELERLYDELNRRNVDAKQKAVETAPEAKPGKSLSDLVGDGPAAEAKAKKQKAAGENNALVKGSQEALSMVAAFRNGGSAQEKTAKATETIAKNSGDTIRLLDKVAENTAEQQGINVVDGGSF